MRVIRQVATNERSCDPDARFGLRVGDVCIRRPSDRGAAVIVPFLRIQETQAWRTGRTKTRIFERENGTKTRGTPSFSTDFAAFPGNY